MKDRPRVLALLLVKPAWGLGGGILTLLAVFGERVFPVGSSPAAGIGVLFAARGIGTAVGPIVARRMAGEGQQRMQASIGISFLIGGIFYMLFGASTSFVLALIVLGVAHCGGSILWVFSTVILQRAVEDNFRGRVFAAELALLTLTMAASNYATGELLDRFGVPPTSSHNRHRHFLRLAGRGVVSDAALVGPRAGPSRARDEARRAARSFGYSSIG